MRDEYTGVGSGEHKSLLSVAAAAAAGALFMFYLDSYSGARRRALVRDKLAATSRAAAEAAGKKARYAANRARGLAAGQRARWFGGPSADEQVHDRIRSRLGHLVSHPKALQVEVDHGQVCLKGHVLTGELDRVLSELKSLPGVKSLRSELTGHQTPETIPHAPEQPAAPRPTEPAHASWTEQGV